MAKAINNKGWDAIGFNQRGCSGEGNKLETSYHFGKSDDLNIVINYINNTYNYQNILLVGYSLGGNVLLKYMGEPQWVKKKHHRCCCVVGSLRNRRLCVSSRKVV
jgi:predicted alpha/beta-fold hydrolase